MDTRRRMLLAAALCVAMALVIACVMPAVADPAGWTRHQLTTDVHDHTELHVSGKRVVWEGGADGLSPQVFMWTVGGSVQQLTHGSRHFVPDISGDRIVCEALDHAGHGQIITWKLSNPSAITTLTSGSQTHDEPRVSGDRVVWQSADAGADQICTWKAGSSATTLTSGTHASSNPQVDGNRVIWETQNSHGYDDVVTWKLGDSSNTTLSVGTNDAAEQVSGDNVIFTAYKGGNWQIYLYDAAASQLTTITTDLHNHYNPAIDGTRIAWDQEDNAGYGQILTRTIADSTIATLTTSGQNTVPQVSGNRIVWQWFYGSNPDQIMTWKVGASAPTTLSAGAYDQHAPVLDGDRVAWYLHDNHSGYDQIMTSGTGLANQPYVTVSKVKLSPKKPVHAKNVTASATVTPAGALTGGHPVIVTKFHTYRTVKKGNKKVKVWYWKTVGSPKAMKVKSGGKVTATIKPKLKGTWSLQIRISAHGDYAAGSSSVLVFKEK